MHGGQRICHWNRNFYKKEHFMSEQKQPELEIQRIYLKDTSLEAPAAPKIFTETWEPEVNVDLDVKHQSIDVNLYEVVLSVTVHAKMKEKSVFLIEVHQAGIFHVANFNEEQTGHLLGAYFPTVLFPYAREVISDLVTKASFPQLNLAPVNFDAIYMQQQEEQKKATNESVAETTKH